MNQRPARRFLILGLIGVGILVLAIGLLLHSSNKKSAFYTQTVTDSCTGQTYTITPNQGPEKFNASNPSVLVGGAPILDSGATQAQYQKIQDALSQYLKVSLRGRYESLTVAPNTIEATSGSGLITAKLCLGMSNNMVDMSIKLTNLQYVQVSIKDYSGKNGGDYDSGQLMVDPSFYQSQP